MESTKLTNIDQRKWSFNRTVPISLIFLKLMFFLFAFCGYNTFAQPSINTVTGDINTALTINGSAFTEKTNAKPLFWWKADFGETPSTLGRKTAWDGNPAFGVGTFYTTIVASGSQQSVGMDHGTSSGAALSRINFESDQLYLYRKNYEDFDITKDYALRTNTTIVLGTPNIGDVVTGQTSGATGTIIELKLTSTTKYLVRYDGNTGTINNQPPTDFINGEQLNCSSGAILTNTENNGVFRSFNFKTIRMWSDAVTGLDNNIHFSAQGLNGSQFRITPEGTEGTTWPGQFTIQPISQLPREWKVEELQYETSGVNVKDGTFNFYQKGILGTDNKFRMKDTDAPNRYNRIFQSQVSHVAQPGSIMYYDALYMDDTWHRVVISKGSTWAARGNVEIQIPAEWNNNQIVVKTNLGGLNLAETPLYLYVVDKNGVANENGFPLQSVLDTTDAAADSTLLLYPNPTSGNITLEIPEVEKGWTYQIISITGQILELGTINASNSNLSFKGLSDGVYFVKLYSEYQKKVIKVIKK